MKKTSTDIANAFDALTKALEDLRSITKLSALDDLANAITALSIALDGLSSTTMLFARDYLANAMNSTDLGNDIDVLPDAPDDLSSYLCQTTVIYALLDLDLAINALTNH